MAYRLKSAIPPLAWNVAAIIVVTVTAVRARSVALAGFGLDSLIEIFASVVVVSELTGTGNANAEPCTSSARRSSPSQATSLSKPPGSSPASSFHVTLLR